MKFTEVASDLRQLRSSELGSSTWEGKAQDDRKDFTADLAVPFLFGPAQGPDPAARVIAAVDDLSTSKALPPSAQSRSDLGPLRATRSMCTRLELARGDYADSRLIGELLLAPVKEAASGPIIIGPHEAVLIAAEPEDLSGMLKRLVARLSDRSSLLRCLWLAQTHSVSGEKIDAGSLERVLHIEQS
jgi:hypothetical protein